jgi:hypothetical protein
MKWFSVQLDQPQPPPNRGKWCSRSGKAEWTVFITNKITPLVLGHFPPSNPGGPPCWASPLAFGLLQYTIQYKFSRYMSQHILGDGNRRMEIILCYSCIIVHRIYIGPWQWWKLAMQPRGPILSPRLGGYSRLWHRVVRPHRLAGRYDNPMPE